MTFATKITFGRFLLVPVFAWLVAWYGRTVAAGEQVEAIRWSAIGLFLLISALDGVDGWVARRFNQQSKLGAFLDPLADKFLLITAIVYLSGYPWDIGNWRIPWWFAALVIGRDSLIVLGIMLVKSRRGVVRYRPHWTGKVCTVSQIVAISWAMLKIRLLPTLWPCGIAAVFVVWSGYYYYQDARKQLAGKKEIK